MKQRGDRIRKLMMSRGVDDVPMPGVPLVELSGDRRVLIEHHRGVVAYGCGEIRVRMSYGLLCISGSGLYLARMTREQLVICGRIDGVHLDKSEGG